MSFQTVGNGNQKTEHVHRFDLNGENSNRKRLPLNHPQTGLEIIQFATTKRQQGRRATQKDTFFSKGVDDSIQD